MKKVVLLSLVFFNFCVNGSESFYERTSRCAQCYRIFDLILEGEIEGAYYEHQEFEREELEIYNTKTDSGTAKYMLEMTLDAFGYPNKIDELTDSFMWEMALDRIQGIHYSSFPERYTRSKKAKQVFLHILNKYKDNPEYEYDGFLYAEILGFMKHKDKDGRELIGPDDGEYFGEEFFYPDNLELAMKIYEDNWGDCYD
jgi:hypothetical protein